MAIVHKTRTQLVVEAIREKILTGSIKAGEPLRQAALADELDVSRIPVREALLQLEAEGLVSFEPHKGATVTALSADQVEELFDLRAKLETDLLAYSIPNLTAKDFQDAERILKSLEQALQSKDYSNTWSELNTQFHNCLYRGANRPQTQELVNTLNKNSDRYIRMHLMLSGSIEQAESEHTALLDSCKKGDIDGAVANLNHHIKHAMEDIKAFVASLE